MASGDHDDGRSGDPPGTRRVIVSESEFWRRSIAGERVPTRDDAAEPGWYARRKFKDGPLVGARIWREELRDDETGDLVADAVTCCEVDGRPADPFDQWSWIAKRPISRAEFDGLLQRPAAAAPPPDPPPPVDDGRAPLPRDALAAQVALLSQSIPVSILKNGRAPKKAKRKAGPDRLDAEEAAEAAGAAAPTGDFLDRLASGAGAAGEGLEAAGRDVTGREPAAKPDGDGGDAARRKPWALPEGCPVTPLGHRDQVFWYLTPSGQRCGLKAREHSQLGVSGLFEGKLGWLFEHYPRLGPDGMKVVGWHHPKAESDLKRACALQGLFDPDGTVRGPGAWRGPKGELVQHAGDELLIYPPPARTRFDVAAIAAWGAPKPVEPERMAAGVRHGGKVYVAWPPEPKPAAESASAADAQRLLALFGRWTWRAPMEAPRLLVGMVAQAYLCGALDWRAHGWVTGDSGMGKSSAQAVYFGLLGRSLIRVADPSAASVRNALNGAARPVALNEIEPGVAHRRGPDLIELARMASDDNETMRADTEGGVRRFSIRASVYFTSVLHPPFQPQDLNRITVLELGPLPPDPDGSAKAFVQRETEAMIERAPFFRERMCQAWSQGRLQHNLAVYEAALKGRGGTARMADQFGALLACAGTMLSDRPAGQADVEDFLAKFGTEEFVAHASELEWALCLNHLLSAPVDRWADGKRMTVGQLALRVAGARLVDADVLAAHGLRVEDGHRPADVKAAIAAGRTPLAAADYEDGPWLVVANNHRGLEQVFAGQRWAGGVWAQALGRVPGAVRGGPMKFAGATSRAIWLPSRPPPGGEAVMSWNEGRTDDAAVTEPGSARP